MSKNLKDIIDLNKYPIHDLNSAKINNIIKKCKSDLEQDSCSTLPNFILPNSLKIMNNELDSDPHFKTQLSFLKNYMDFLLKK